MARVEVVVPCYNYGRYLPECVASILGQALDEVRVLVIDDASTDDSAQVAARLAASDPRIEVIAHEENRGHIDTYNEGIERADADYLMILSADDRLAPGALRRAVAILDSDPDVVLVHGGCIEWQSGRGPPAADTSPGERWTRYEGAEFAWEFCYCGFNIVHTPTVIVRTGAQKSLGGYRHDLPHSGDMEMFLRFATRGAAARVHATQAFKRCHPTNMSSAYLSHKWRDCQQRKMAFDRFFDEYAAHLPGADRMRARAEREMAESAFWTGIAQLCEGRFESGRSLMRFATALRPGLRHAPPLSRLLREPALHRHLARLAGSWWSRLAQR